MIRTKKRKKGKIYEAVVIMKGSSVSKSFESYKEAEKWQNQVRALRDQGKEISSGPVTVQQMFDAYLEYAEEKGRTTGTIKTAKGRFYNHILPGYGAHLDMTTVTYEEHQTLLRMLMKKGVKPATRNRVRSLVRTLYSLAIRHRLFGGVFKTNPFDSIEPTDEPKKAIQYWNQEQVESFLEANLQSYYYPLFLFLFKTGLRIGEALGIHVEQIDKSSQLLTVDRQFDQAKNEIVHSTKGKKIRRVYLIDEVIEALSPLLKDGLIFRNEDGSPVVPNHFSRAILPKACMKAKLNIINPHATRHSFAASYLMSGGVIYGIYQKF